MINRRSMFKWLGLGLGAASAASAALPSPPAGHATPTEAFKYWCDCGSEIIAKVPKEAGTKLTVTCETCLRQYAMTWTGKGFQVEAAIVGISENGNYVAMHPPGYFEPEQQNSEAELARILATAKKIEVKG